MAKCMGTIENHCCWLNGQECKYLIKNGDGSIRCGLLVEVGSWERVYKLQRYLRNVKPVLRAVFNDDTNCGDWPRVGEKCNACNING